MKYIFPLRLFELKHPVMTFTEEFEEHFNFQTFYHSDPTQNAQNRTGILCTGSAMSYYKEAPDENETVEQFNFISDRWATANRFLITWERTEISTALFRFLRTNAQQTYPIGVSAAFENDGVRLSVPTPQAVGEYRLYCGDDLLRTIEANGETELFVPLSVSGDYRIETLACDPAYQDESLQLPFVRKSIFYRLNVPMNRLDKSEAMGEPIVLPTEIRDESAVCVRSAERPDCNYAYLSDFGRYYFVQSVKRRTEGEWELALSCDLLQTYSDEIKNVQAFIARQEYSSDPDLTDEKMPLKKERKVLYYEGDEQFTADKRVQSANVVVNVVDGYDDPDETNEDADRDGSDFFIPSNRRQASSSRFVKTYVLNEENFEKFAVKASADGKLASCIANVLLFPFDVADEHADGTTVIQPVHLGFTPLGGKVPTDAGVKGIRLDGAFRNDKTFQFDLSEGIADGYAGKFPLCRISLYLPYYGFTEIRPEALGAQKTVGIKYVVDYKTGNAEIFLYDSDETVFRILECRLGLDLPISYASSYPAAHEIAQSGIFALGAAMKAEEGCCGSGEFRAFNGGAYYRQKPYAVIQASEKTADEGDFARTFGLPCGKIERIGNLHGFTVVGGDFDLPLPSASMEEKEKIKEILHRGFVA